MQEQQGLDSDCSMADVVTAARQPGQDLLKCPHPGEQLRLTTYFAPKALWRMFTAHPRWPGNLHLEGKTLQCQTAASLCA